jgi:hypothetical protein
MESVMRIVFPMAASVAFALSPALAADPAHPVVVELYQSQGCSSCPPADANLNAIAGDPNILALNFSVTYWDNLGWKDTFAKPAFTARQWDFAHAGARDNVSTPQVIVNGRGVLVGNDRGQLDASIRRFDRGTAGPLISHDGGKIMIGAGNARVPATIWFIEYDPRVQNVPIRAGENGGRTLPHRNIVRMLKPLGQWTGAPVALAAPARSDPAYRSAILIQDGKGGAIVAASRL